MSAPPLAVRSIFLEEEPRSLSDVEFLVLLVRSPFPSCRSLDRPSDEGDVDLDDKFELRFVFSLILMRELRSPLRPLPSGERCVVANTGDPTSSLFSESLLECSLVSSNSPSFLSSVTPAVEIFLLSSCDMHLL